jgi:glycerol-3-phosphate acyltransferase PlsY
MDDFIDYLGSYLIGSIPTTSLAKKALKGNYGEFLSGTLQFLKGASAVFMAHKLSPADPPDMVAAGFLVLMGDRFPVFSRFKGTQSLGTLVGVFTSLIFCLMGKI